ncbi:MAG: tRNA (adenosine(37)-N6)-threonylcarbamoyltransferase complex ATPase subunit type 1 TsaE [Syntrophobacteraceae bacterium]|jgi:tRNA threonylcarbamoyladenosine biosynthesis protein TsaE|nr:tRNA (adenosine(37)-N6)-threonylcarbamoyltransferase complex ATPase subunit type 1 TsaE [Syntrophobacteraceae bacterium]
MNRIVLRSRSEGETLEMGLWIGRNLAAGDVIALWGELGAGKTFLTRAIALGLGVPERIPVTSPTFTFINEYEGRLHIYHMDLYRLTDLTELDTLPWMEALYGTGVSLIEWPERLGTLMPEERWDIRIEITGDEARTITLEPLGKANVKKLKRWGDEWSRWGRKG